jgi:post-segregation antitoxin (ccd killing protein)
MSESLITVRVPRALKEKMKKAKINWSEELRKTITAKLEVDRKRRSEEELVRVLESVKPGFDTLSAIREARRNG